MPSDNKYKLEVNRNGGIQNGKFVDGGGGHGEKGQDVEIPHLFCQMDLLYHFVDGDMEWRETARWIKYEERVEVGERWSKPYVATVSLHALLELRSCISDGVVLLDLGDPELLTVADQIVQEVADARNLSAESKQKILYILTRPHKHQHHKGINKKLYEGKLGIWNSGVDLNESTLSLVEENSTAPNTPDMSTVDKMRSRFPFPELPKDGTVPTPENKNYKPNKRFKKKVPKGAEAANILIGEVDFLSHPIMVFVRMRNATHLEDMVEVKVPTKFLFLLLGPPEHHSIWEYEEVGRACASLLTDKLFTTVAHQAKDRQALLYGIDEYIDDLTVLPPNIWDPSTRLEPPNKTADRNSTLRARRRLASRERHVTIPQALDEEEEQEEEEPASDDRKLARTGRLFGGLVGDMKRRYRLYWSDLRDAFSLQALASIVFIYFACLTPTVTLGGILGDATDGYMGTVEALLAGCICGVAYSLLSAQPLSIMGATGPMLVFESLLYQVCKEFGVEFLPFRFWIGMWSCFLLLIIVAFDLSVFVRFITRFTEESFAVLISVIFIYESVSKQILTIEDNPVKFHTTWHSNLSCNCLPLPCGINASDTCVGLEEPPLDPLQNWSARIHSDCFTMDETVNIRHGCLTFEQCSDFGGNLTGSSCHDKWAIGSVPDVFLFQCFLFLLTFGLAWVLANFRNSSFFPTFVRNFVADFAVLVAVLVGTGTDLLFSIETTKLPVPSELKTTRPGRPWVVNPLAMSHWWFALLAVVPALLATTLIFLDHQITVVITNRKENKLKKGYGYHLDLFIVALLVVVCSTLGFPWYVAATVRTINHVRSLSMQSESSAPGEKPVFLGVREQRLTNGLCHVLIGVSIFLTAVLKFIPMSVLYGVFLYMGVASLRGVQFVQRIFIVFMPQKYQPDYVYLRHVRTYRVHIFTGIQILCMAAMWAVRMTQSIAIAFPLVILALILVRKLMSFIFTNQELSYLDDLSPEESRRQKEDKLIKTEGAGEFLTEIEEEPEADDNMSGLPMKRRSSAHSLNHGDRKASVHAIATAEALKRKASTVEVPSRPPINKVSSLDKISAWREMQTFPPEEKNQASIQIPHIASWRQIQAEMRSSCEKNPAHNSAKELSTILDGNDVTANHGRPSNNALQPKEDTGGKVAFFEPIGTGPEDEELRGVEIQNPASDTVVYNTKC